MPEATLLDTFVPHFLDDGCGNPVCPICHWTWSTAIVPESLIFHPTGDELQFKDLSPETKRTWKSCLFSGAEWKKRCE